MKPIITIKEVLDSMPKDGKVGETTYEIADINILSDTKANLIVQVKLPIVEEIII